MGLLKQKVSKYNKEYLARGGMLNDRILKKWFGEKRAVKRSGSILDSIEFGPKSAVVIVGPSGIGKTTYVKKFMKEYPDFRLCSHDDYFYKVTENVDLNSQAAKEAATSRAVDLLEKNVMDFAKKGTNIIIDGLLINAGFRAAILNTLEHLGYTTYVVYFTSQYTEKVLLEFSKRRALELILFNDSVFYGEGTREEIMSVRDRVMEIYAEKLNVTPEQLYQAYKNSPEVVKSAKELVNLVRTEMKAHYYRMQEENGAFLYGADYYFEITEIE